jgi:long-chain acyl-CoA synthetase
MQREKTGQPQGAVLLTGATGFVGSELLLRYVRQAGRRVYALVRGRDPGEATQRLRNAIAPLGEELPADRVVAVPADLERPQLGLDARRRAQLAGEVTDVVHAAASVSFSLPLAESREINVEGTRRVLDFAHLSQRRGGLRRLAYVSTAYVAGAHRGPFAEADLEVGQTFRNPYEHSKFEAERLVRRERRHLPTQIFRPSIVVGEAATGWTGAFNVLYTPLKAFVQGRLPVLPARPSAPVDVVPVDYVADAIVDLADRPADDGTYHLVAGDRTTSVGELVDLAAAHLDRSAPLVLPPSLYRGLLHPMLKRRAPARRRRALERLEAFFPYFAMDVTYDDHRARAALAASGIEAPPIGSYFGRLIDFAERSHWGNRRIGRDDALARSGVTAAAAAARP